jgi:hypothetical protein
MRYLLVPLCLLTLVLIAAKPAQALAPACSVSPNPDTIGGIATVSITGVVPGASYYVKLTEPGSYQTGHHPYGFTTADANGNASLDVTLTNPPLNFTPVPGTINVGITNYPSGAKVTTCSFDVS